MVLEKRSAVLDRALENAVCARLVTNAGGSHRSSLSQRLETPLREIEDPLHERMLSLGRSPFRARLQHEWQHDQEDEQSSRSRRDHRPLPPRHRATKPVPHGWRPRVDRLAADPAVEIAGQFQRGAIAL